MMWKYCKPLTRVANDLITSLLSLLLRRYTHQPPCIAWNVEEEAHPRQKRMRVDLKGAGCWHRRVENTDEKATKLMNIRKSKGHLCAGIGIHFFIFFLDGIKF